MARVCPHRDPAVSKTLLGPVRSGMNKAWTQFSGAYKKQPVERKGKRELGTDLHLNPLVRPCRLTTVFNASQWQLLLYEDGDSN